MVKLLERTSILTPIRFGKLPVVIRSGRSWRRRILNGSLKHFLWECEPITGIESRLCRTIDQLSQPLGCEKGRIISRIGPLTILSSPPHLRKSTCRGTSKLHTVVKLISTSTSCRTPLVSRLCTICLLLVE